MVGIFLLFATSAPLVVMRLLEASRQWVGLQLCASVVLHVDAPAGQKLSIGRSGRRERDDADRTPRVGVVRSTARSLRQWWEGGFDKRRTDECATRSE